MAAPADVEDMIIFSTLSILQIIKDSQQQHGLRHGDYMRYRSYCSRRVHRIRKSLHATHTHKHKGNFQFKGIKLDMVSDSRYLLVPLFEAERSWAYAMQLKQEANSEPRKNFHLVNRLRKAVQHSELLESLCKGNEAVDAQTKLEAQAYNAWMNGNFQFETNNWAKALEFYNASKTIYEKLAQAISDSATVQLYGSRCSEMAPQLRYCAYNIGDESAGKDLAKMDLNKTDDGAHGELDTLLAQMRTAQMTTQKPEITWCGHVIATDKPKIADFCAKLLDFDDRIQKCVKFDEKVENYERLIMDCRDTIQALTDETKSVNSGGKSKTKSDDHEVVDNVDDRRAHSSIQLLLSYLSYIRLSKSVERTMLTIGNLTNGGKSLLLANGGESLPEMGEKDGGVDALGAGKGAKPQDLIRLYDSALQFLEELRELPGTETNTSYQQELEASERYYRAFRSMFVVESLAQSGGRWRECHAMCQRAIQYTQQAQALLSGAGAKKNLRQLLFASSKTVGVGGKKANSNAAAAGGQQSFEGALVPNPESLTKLLAKLNVAKFTAYANCLEADSNSSTAVGKHRTGGTTATAAIERQQDVAGLPPLDIPLDEQLNTYRSWSPEDIAAGKIPPLTRLPPDFESIPCKPLFFDVALNHVTFPSLEGVLSGGVSGVPGTEADGKEQAGAGGLSGLVKGWFWGGGK